MAEDLRRAWAHSRSYRAALVLAIGYACVRLIVHGVYLAMMLHPESGAMGDMPAWAGTHRGPMLPVDLQIYIDAAERVQDRQPLYSVADKIEVFQYAPAYAVAFVPFLGLSAPALVIVHTGLHIAAYAGLYIGWGRIFRKLGLGTASAALAMALPVWLIFASFWSDLGYLNIYIIVAFMATLLLEAVFYERLSWALLWLSLILQVKPHWAFALVVPCFLGRYRFFLKLIGWSAVAYLGFVGITALVTDPTYAVQQYRDYVRFLLTMPATFPWRGPEAPFLGYNHAIKQVVVYVLGVTPTAMRIATGVKVVLLLPLVGLGAQHLLHPLDRPGYRVPRLSLDLAFAAYLGAFIWLDMVWEASLGVVLFPYLLATVARPAIRTLIRGIFGVYAFIDVIRLMSLILLGTDIIAPGLYILTDPSLYVPVVMLTILVFYGVLVSRLWRPARHVTTTVLGAFQL